MVEKFVLQLEAQLADRNVTIELSPEAAEWLGENGYDDQFGARPLGRVIQEHIKKPLAEELLFGRLEGGGTVRVIVETPDEGKKKLGFEIVESRTKKPSSDDEDGAEDDKGGEKEAKPARRPPPSGGPSRRPKKSPRSPGSGEGGPRRRASSRRSRSPDDNRLRNEKRRPMRRRCFFGGDCARQGAIERPASSLSDVAPAEIGPRCKDPAAGIGPRFEDPATVTAIVEIGPLWPMAVGRKVHLAGAAPFRLVDPVAVRRRASHAVRALAADALTAIPRQGARAHAAIAALHPPARA